MIAIYKNKFIERLITNKKVGIRHDIENNDVYFMCPDDQCWGCNYRRTCGEIFGDKHPHLDLNEAQKYIDEYPEYLI